MNVDVSFSLVIVNVGVGSNRRRLHPHIGWGLGTPGVRSQPAVANFSRIDTRGTACLKIVCGKPGDVDQQPRAADISRARRRLGQHAGRLVHELLLRRRVTERTDGRVRSGQRLTRVGFATMLWVSVLGMVLDGTVGSVALVVAFALALLVAAVVLARTLSRPDGRLLPTPSMQLDILRSLVLPDSLADRIDVGLLIVDVAGIAAFGLAVIRLG